VVVEDEEQGPEQVDQLHQEGWQEAPFMVQEDEEEGEEEQGQYEMDQDNAYPYAYSPSAYPSPYAYPPFNDAQAQAALIRKIMSLDLCLFFAKQLLFNNLTLNGAVPPDVGCKTLQNFTRRVKEKEQLVHPSLLVAELPVLAQRKRNACFGAAQPLTHYFSKVEGDPYYDIFNTDDSLAFGVEKTGLKELPLYFPLEVSTCKDSLELPVEVLPVKASAMADFDFSDDYELQKLNQQVVSSNAPTSPLWRTTD